MGGGGREPRRSVVGLAVGEYEPLRRESVMKNSETEGERTEWNRKAPPAKQSPSSGSPLACPAAGYSAPRAGMLGWAAEALPLMGRERMLTQPERGSLASLQEQTSERYLPRARRPLSNAVCICESISDATRSIRGSRD